MKQILLLVIIFLLGLFIGKSFFSSNQVVVRTETIPFKSGADKQIKSLNNAFSNLSKNQLLNYTKLKSEKDKLERAEDIIGKMILLFLVNIGMKIEEPVKEYFLTRKKTGDAK